MDIEDQFLLEHLLFKERICRSCNKTKSLMDDFYITRKGRESLESSYSYECKYCTINRIIQSRKKNFKSIKWEYPDW